MRLPRLSQQTIVFAIFVLMFAGFAVLLPGFLNAGEHAGAAAERRHPGHSRPGHGDHRHRPRHRHLDGRGAGGAGRADPADGAGRPFGAGGLCRSRWRWRWCSGWSTAGSSPMPRCRRCSRRWPRACSWPGSARWRSSVSTSCSGVRHSTPSPGSGRGTLAGIPMPVIDVRRGRAGWSPSSCAARGWAPTSTPSATTRFGARTTGIPTRPVIVLQYVLAALIGIFAGLVMAASVNSMPTRIYNST